MNADLRIRIHMFSHICPHLVGNITINDDSDEAELRYKYMLLLQRAHDDNDNFNVDA